MMIVSFTFALSRSRTHWGAGFLVALAPSARLDLFFTDRETVHKYTSQHKHKYGNCRVSLIFSMIIFWRCPRNPFADFMIISDFNFKEIQGIHFRVYSRVSKVAQMARCHITGPRVYSSIPTHGGLWLRLGGNALTVSADTTARHQLCQCDHLLTYHHSSVFTQIGP